MARIDEKETRDEVVQEVRRIKDTLAGALDFDIDRIVKDARKRQETSNRTVLAPPVRRNV
jgi:hypothetical protein